MSKQFISRKLRSTNSQLITEHVDMTISKSVKLFIENVVEKNNIIVDGDREKTKKDVVIDKMLIDSHVDSEGNNMKSNNVVKIGKKLRQKSKTSVKFNELSSERLTLFIKPKAIDSYDIRQEYLKEFQSSNKKLLVVNVVLLTNVLIKIQC